MLGQRLNEGVTIYEFIAGAGNADNAKFTLNGWVPADGGVTGFGLLELLGGCIFSSNTQPKGFQTYTLSSLTPGKTSNVKLFYRPWAATAASVRPIDLTFTNGATVEQPFGALPTDRPGNRSTMSRRWRSHWWLRFRSVASSSSAKLLASG